MTENLHLSHEQVDDVPLLLGLMQRLGFPETLDRHLGNHGHHRGISNGWLATIWLSYILSQSDHRKSSVQEWADELCHTLETVTGQTLRPGIELNDDRLGIVLRRLNKEEVRNGIDADLWLSSVAVYDLALESVRLDSTTTYGYHRPDEDGVMQHGHSKDHRPDLPQLKLMAAAAAPSGQMIACDVHPGNAADDPLYVPLIERVRQIVGRSGLLYVDDSKMAPLTNYAACGPFVSGNRCGHNAWERWAEAVTVWVFGSADANGGFDTSYKSGDVSRRITADALTVQMGHLQALLEGW